MKKYETTVVSIIRTELITELNAFGSQGWHVVASLDRYSDERTQAFVLQRLLSD